MTKILWAIEIRYDYQLFTQKIGLLRSLQDNLFKFYLCNSRYDNIKILFTIILQKLIYK